MGTPVTHSTAEVREILEGACAQRSCHANDHVNSLW